jgi:ABC-2 type transport system ATP-binding protein
MSTLLAPAIEDVPASPDGRAMAVELCDLTKRFATRRRWIDLLRHPLERPERVLAVDRLSCRVERGELFGFLGPNGAGKTTAFKILSTLILPDSGTACIAGHDLVTDPEGVRRVLSPVIADERSLNWRISARENLQFFATLYGLRAGAASESVSELLEVVGLEKAGHKMVGEFSSGMKQRLLLARSLLAQPQVLLLDEPTRSLDPLAARSFRTFLREQVVLAKGCTVLLATHNSEEALELCDRVVVMNEGKTVAIGRPKDLIQDHQEARYRLWTRTPEGGGLRRLRASITNREQAPQPGWTIFEMTVEGGEEEAAGILEELIRGGTSVARFEKVPVPLADLIERLLDGKRSANGR